jgi:hypothetical protein
VIPTACAVAIVKTGVGAIRFHPRFSAAVPKMIEMAGGERERREWPVASCQFLHLTTNLTNLTNEGFVQFASFVVHAAAMQLSVDPQAEACTPT